MCIFENKKALRKEILTRRKNMNIIEKEKMDKMISEQFYESRYYREATNIFIYISYDSEIDTKSIISKALKDNKRIYVPRTEFATKIMDAVEIKSFDNLIKTNYGLLEPSKKEPYINPNELDLIVVPGVAFDRNGGRMGYGAGFYDRFFKRINGNGIKKITKLALAYSLQVLDEVPMSEQDIPVDFIITEKEFIG